MQLFLVERDQLSQRLQFATIRLRQLFQLSSEDVLSVFVGLNLIKNCMNCSKCGKAMNINKRAELQDGIQWKCKSKGVQCSSKSIRDGSFFSKSSLSLSTLLLLSYMWAGDFDNKHACRELDLDKNTVVDWFNLFREVCQNYCNNAKSIGGPSKIIEIDESCISKRKYNRGSRRPGHQQWIFGGIERGVNGRAFAFWVPDRKKKTLLKIIRRKIKRGTTIMSDDWPAYRKLGKQMGKPIGYKHFSICHKRNFARNDMDRDNNPIRVHTNKVQGFWMLVKHKIKRLRGTRSGLISSYVAEAVFRQNAVVDKTSVLE